MSQLEVRRIPAEWYTSTPAYFPDPLFDFFEVDFFEGLVPETRH